MIGDLSHSDVANEMSMMRSVFKGTFLVVEGSSDFRLYSKFIDAKNATIIIAHSKTTVIHAVEDLVRKRKDDAVIGFVDRDMDSLLGKKNKPPVFSTDKRDLEATILSTPALDDVLAEYGDPTKLKEFVQRYGSVGEVIAKAADSVGLLMYISYRKGMNLSFKDLDHEKFIARDGLKVEFSKLVASVFANSMPQSYPRAAITEQLHHLCERWGPSWDIARGHDAVAVLRLGLRYVFGSYNSRNLSDGELGGALRLAYNWEYFEGSDLYGESSEWCKKNGLALWRDRGD